MALVVKSLPANAGDLRNPGSIPRSGRSPGGVHINSLQYPCHNSIDRGAWLVTVYKVAKSWTGQKLLSTQHTQLVRELILGRLTRSAGHSRRRKGQAFFFFFFFPYIPLSQSHKTLLSWALSCYGNNLFCLKLTLFRLRANDYTEKNIFLLKGMFFIKLCTNI